MPPIIPVYDKIESEFHSHPLETPEATKQAIKELYQMDLSRSQVRSIVSSGVSHPERFVRSSAEQRQARQLMEQMRENIANDIAMRPAIDDAVKKAYSPDVIQFLGRCTSFFRSDEGDDVAKFNEDLSRAAAQKDEKATAALMYQEMTRLLNKFDIKEPQDLTKLHNLTDQQLTKDYADLRRMANLMTETVNGYGKKFHSGFLPEQLDYIFQFKDIPDALASITYRSDLIANPLYVEYDPYRMMGERIDPDSIQSHIESAFDDPEADSHPATAFFARLNHQNAFEANSFLPRVEAAEPALKGALFHDDGLMTLAENKPLIAYSEANKKQYVVTNSQFINKIPTVPEYMQTLSERGAKANKWLLTGSQEFDDMMEAWNRLQLFQADPSSSSKDLKQLTTDVKEAALKYFKHKHIDDIEKTYLGHASLHGKNKREQSRLEVAADILEFAQAESTMLEKVSDLKATKAKEAKPERMADNVLRVVNPDVISADGKQKFVESLPDKISTLFGREPPLMQKVEIKTEGGKDIKQVTRHRVIEQDEFSALCALATGSPKTHYNIPLLDSQGKVLKDPVTGKDLFESKMNTNPEETYKNTLTAIMGSHTVNDVPRELGRMLRGATTTTSRAVEYGRFDALGPMLADGLKLNNKMMQEMQSQKRFTPEFYACAKLTANALNVMEKPEFKGLKTIVESQLSAEDLQTAKACQGIYNVISEGLHAQKMLASRFTMSDKAKAFDRGDGGILDDMAKFCHMYGVEKQFATNMQLNNCNYGKVPDYANQVNLKLAGDKNINDFVDQLAKMSKDERFAAIKKPQEMANLFQSCAENAKAALQQNQAQQPQLTMAQPQIQPQPQPQPSAPPPFA